MQFVRSSATVGGLTMVSRLFGFVRDILIAGTLGTGPVADAFIAAFRFPNLFRRFFAEGAFSFAFVPLFARKLEAEGLVSARRFAEEVLPVLLVAVVVFTILAETGMPWLVYLIAPGFADTPEKFDMVLLFSRIVFPYLLFMSVIALLAAVLNSLGRFAAAAAVPVLLNVMMIAAILFLAPHMDNPGTALSWGVALAGIAQFVALLWACKRAGLRLRLRFPKITPAVRRLAVLGTPAVLAGGATQLNLLVGTIIVSWQDGAIAWLYYADRLYQLPLGIIGIAIGVVLLPDLSRRLRAGETAAAMTAQNRALELALLLTIPSAVALAVIAGPVIQVLFERGAFTPDDTKATAQALAIYAIGLPAFVMTKIFSTVFFSREDTLTPMRFAFVSIIVNITASLILFWWVGFLGVVMATSLAACLHATLLGTRLFRLGYFRTDARLGKRLSRVCLAAFLMGACLWAGATLAAPFLAAAFFVKISVLGALVLGGLLVFAGFCQITGAVTLDEIRQSLRL